MSPEGQKLIDEATEAITVQASAAVLITTLADFIRANANDPVALLAKADELDASSNALQAAIVANTPAA
jgi:hypothetical protein